MYYCSDIDRTPAALVDIGNTIKPLTVTFKVTEIVVAAILTNVSIDCNFMARVLILLIHDFFHRSERSILYVNNRVYKNNFNSFFSKLCSKASFLFSSGAN